ncbi:MAG TPA: MFS transporter [Candidatus Binataceae bacterium]|nr:MFS transporter [Candidatus Binataceae bacterium]
MGKIGRPPWMIAASLFVALFFLWGSFNTSPIFVGALLKSFHWSHARVAWIPSILALAVGVTSPAAGWLLDRFEAPFVMTTGAILTAAGLIAAGHSHTFNGLFCSTILFGIGLGASTWLAASVVIANWFGEHRGTVLGLATAGMESGGMAMSMLAGYMIAHSGWRAAYLALSIPASVIVVPLLALVVRTRPADQRGRTVAEAAKALPGFEVGEAIRTRAFWMLVVAECAYGAAVGGTFIHLVAYLQSLNYREATAVMVVSILLGMAAIGKPTMGFLGDKIGGRNALGVGFILMAGAILFLLNLHHPALLIPYMLLAGLSGAAPVALVPMVLAETLGLRRFGTLFGWIGMLLTVGIFIGPILVGKLYDLSGSYSEGFIVCVLIALVGAGASFACSAPPVTTTKPGEIGSELRQGLSTVPASSHQ